MLARTWSSDASTRMLGWVWQGYDSLREVLAGIDWSLATDDLERDITQLLEPRIRAHMPDPLPFYIQHEVCERETRKPRPAQPPKYDLAFVSYGNPRIMWPLEAKVLKTDRDVAKYVRDVREELLTCRYAPFSSEAGMIGYLLSGDPEAAFARIASALKVALEDGASSAGRPHKTSDHLREVPPEKRYPRNFRCHHLMMAMNPLPMVPPPEP